MKSVYLYGQEDRVLPWMAERIQDMAFEPGAKAIGHERSGELVGAVAYDRFTRNSCIVHLASDGSRRWLTREFAIRTMAYPFIQCGFNRITALVTESNEASLRFTRRFGFVEEGRLREEAENEEDVVVLGLLRRECRFLPT